jgi:hypothetical protein
MEIRHVLSIMGTLLTAVGALLTAYDILRGPVRVTTRRLFMAQAEILSGVYLRLLAKYRELPEGHERKDEWIKEAEALAKKSVEQATDEWRHFEEKEQETSFRLGIRGLLLIAVGALMECLANLLAIGV